MVLRYPFISLLALFLLQGTITFAQGDTCTTALEVVSGVHYANGPSTGAGVDCVTGGALSYNGDWYSYTPSFSGTIQITSCHTLNQQPYPDTYLYVLTGSCGSLTCLFQNDDMGACNGYPFFSMLEIPVVQGETYFIVWTDNWSNSAFYWELRECAGTVTGVTYRDANSNGVRDTGEEQVDVMLQVDPGAQFRYAGQAPYSFCSSIGTYTISVPTPPVYHNAVPATRTYTVAAQGDQVTGMDFAFQPIPGMYDAAVTLWGWNPWIGNNTQLHIHYSNPGTEPIEASVLLTLDPLLSYVSASTPATSVNGPLVTWDLGTLQPGSSGTINVTVFTSISATPNAPILNTVILATEESDVNAANNADDMHGIATTSFDPNDKAVDLVSITPEQVIAQQKLEYTIRFQNTGNAPAVNVVIKDSLDADWDLSTFEMIGATHPYSLTITNEVAIWTFANIMLPDSATDPLGSQGSFTYRMAARPTLQLGEQLTNRADIYFDYNEPVLTNTTVTTVELNTNISDGTRQNTFDVFPNPSNGQLQLRYNAAALGHAQLTVLDALGRMVYTSSITGLSQGRAVSLDLAGLHSGTYIARLTADGVEERVRFVIRR
ncbi:MAG: T9SS type A sorting domain-containing protein [Flavobacteriales bacterium]|nr:T9SS type A sorting domain-containing protein [Flavobacteriales bacterium]